jgi:hypothetical protein
MFSITLFFHVLYSYDTLYGIKNKLKNILRTKKEYITIHFYINNLFYLLEEYN